MADNKQSNDEYQMPDLEGYQEQNYDELAYNADTSSASKANVFSNNPVIKKAGLVVAIAISAMIAYKFLGPMFTRDADAPTSTLPDVQTEPDPFPAPTPSPLPPVTQPAPVTPTDRTMRPADNLAPKVAALEVAQQGTRANIDDLRGQVRELGRSIDNLATKMAGMNQNLEMMRDKFEQQAQELHRLRARKKAPVKVSQPKRQLPAVTWNVQAVIPGRAWLIASNGSTLTVRKGTTVPGLGTVRMIDAQHGKVMMSSGRIIAFSMQDS
ncbi:MAG: type IVB secretion system protein IcmG/DotF [Legionellaceae bacterium]|nr:type IVB secretion system protein IcmG/DotF [Legionellaceae bacterium]